MMILLFVDMDKYGALGCVLLFSNDCYGSDMDGLVGIMGMAVFKIVCNLLSHLQFSLLRKTSYLPSSSKGP